MHASNKEEHFGTEQQHSPNGCPVNERFNQRLIQCAPNVVLFLSPDHLILEFNPEAERLYGRKREDVLGKDYIEEFLPDDTREAVAADIEKVLAGKTTRGFENAVVTNDGQERVLRWNIDSVLDSESKPIGIVAVGQDITEREKVEKKLSENNKIMERIFETTHFHVVLLDSKCNFIRVNKAYADSCGFEPDYFIGKNHFDLYPSEELESEFQRVVKTGDPYIVYSKPFEFPDQPERGITYWDFAVYPVNKASGEVEGLLFTLLEVTERKKTEELLKVKDTAIASSISVMALTDIEGRMTYVNDSIVKMWGYDSADEILGRCLPEFWEGDGVFKTIQALREKGGKIGEDVGKRKDGSLFNVQFAASMIKDEAGNPLYMFGSFLDITERKKAEKALLESEQKYKTLFESVGDALFTMDFTEEGSHFVDCNEHTLKLFGCTHRDQIIGKTPEDFSPPTQPDGQPSAEKAFELATAVMEGHPQIFEWMNCRLDGTSFWVEVNLNRMELKGKPHMQAVVRDITQRKQAEEAVRKSEEKYRTLFESANDAIFAMDVDDNGLHFKECNSHTMEMFGCRREDIIGKSPVDFSPSAQPDGTLSTERSAQLCAAALAGEPQHFEWKHCRFDGTEFDAEVTLNCVDIAGETCL